MKVTTTPKAPKAVGKKYVRVAFHDEALNFLKEKDGISTLMIGTGTKKAFSRRSLRTLCRLVVRTAREHKLTHITVAFTDERFQCMKDVTADDIYRIAAENFIIAEYEFSLYKTKRGKKRELAEVLISGARESSAPGAVRRGVTVGTYVNHCRDIANTPGGDMTPALLGSIAKRLARGTKVRVKVLGKAEVQKLKMGALMGVARGSKEGPRFIILEYWGAGKLGVSSKKIGGAGKQGGGNKHKNNPIVFVGKGITFDTGGLNLKPGDSMLDMHLDMSGGAAVIAAVVAAAKLNIRKNIIGLVPAAENSIGNESFRPGDILTSMSGKTIDVLNTDAEGRLVLADALTYATRYTPKLVIDVATLTGAALVALGQHASALMTADTTVQEKLMALGEDSGDYLWPLPLWDEYRQYTKGLHGDVANIPWQGNPRAGGAINGGMFLAHFAKGYPWAHIDMAPRMTAAPGDRLAKGATGEPVRFLLSVAEKYA